jgi:hypothetical protein
LINLFWEKVLNALVHVTPIKLYALEGGKKGNFWHHCSIHIARVAEVEMIKAKFVVAGSINIPVIAPVTLVDRINKPIA